MVKVGELKKVLDRLPNDMTVLISSDEEWNSIRECEFTDFGGYIWSTNRGELCEVDNEDDINDDEHSCLVLS